MKKYQVTIKGENYLLSLNGEIGKFGFTATRFVKARNPDEAEKMAKIIICHDEDLRGSIVNEGNGPPLLKLEKLTEINFLSFLWKKKTKGYSFFSEDERTDSADTG
jgi:hypothetical protein